MIKTRGRKILRDVLSRKGRTTMVAISIMIGVFGAVTLISANDLLIRQIKDDIQPDEVAMLRVFVTVPTAGTNVQTEDGDDQVLSLVENRRSAPRVLRSLVGITDIEGQAMAPVFWQKTGDERFQEADIMAFSEPFGEIDLEPMRLVDGEWPQPGQHELAVEQRMADENNLHVGDTIQFRPLGQTDAEPEEWTITAVAFHPYWVETGGGENQPERRLFANFDDAQQLAGFSGYTSYYLRYVDKQTAWNNTENLKETIAEETNYIPTMTWTDDPDDYFLIGEVQEVTNILNMLAVVALIVSGFLVTNVINTIVVEQKRQIGVIKSLGATRTDNFLIYSGIALLYGIIGTIPGVLLGIVVGSMMAQAVAPLAFTLIDGFKVSPTGVVIGAVMGLMVPVVAALIPVFNGTRVTILDAMTDLGISGNWGRGPMARLIKRLPLPANIRQALSNVVQKKGRLLLTVITLTLAASAFMGVFAMFTVITDEIDKVFDTFQYELMVIPTEAQDYDQLKTLIQQVDEVAEVKPGSFFNVKVLDLDGTALSVGFDGEDDLMSFGIDPAANTMDLVYNAGTGWQDGSEREGVVLTQPAADALDKSVGDQVILTAGGRSGEFEVIGIVSYPFPFGILRWQDLSQLAGFVYDGGTPDDESDDVPLPLVVFVTMQDRDASAKEVNFAIDDISETLLNAGITASYENQVETQEEIAEQMLVFNMIFQITSGVMAAVGAIGLLTTLSMAVFERQKEIGVMRSIGAGSSTIVSQFLVEGILIGLLAWALAIPLSYLLAIALLDGMGFAEFIDFSYPLWVLGMGLVGMIIVAALASLWPSLSAARRTVSDILRYQ
ncbi:MAG: ABC transporter permease [Anaerolineae bacterium]|nr:ABC transporter permease [Anaerolineae bacterium]